MDFREEYKKSAEVMTPSAEAMERMTKNIMEQINAPAKKAIPFKKISYIGGAVAACALISGTSCRVYGVRGNKYRCCIYFICTFRLHANRFVLSYTKDHLFYKIL